MYFVSSIKLTCNLCNTLCQYQQANDCIFALALRGSFGGIWAYLWVIRSRLSWWWTFKVNALQWMLRFNLRLSVIDLFITCIVYTAWMTSHVCLLLLHAWCCMCENAAVACVKWLLLHAWHCCCCMRDIAVIACVILLLLHVWYCFCCICDVCCCCMGDVCYCCMRDVAVVAMTVVAYVILLMLHAWCCSCRLLWL